MGGHQGRQGREGRTHLMSPIMAAAAAVNGKLSDVREFIEDNNISISAYNS